MTDAEHQALVERAGRVGLSVPRLMVEASLADDVRTVSERRGLVVEFSGAKQLAAAIGNNLNQLARAANATGVIPEELAVTLVATRRVLSRLETAVEAMGGRGR
ncbi:MobC family plasmid mobilization relaxosome protein [Actinocorallia sp. API 0066]|nr:MobC family plasmid mobilization relaxosome protein [Actinocorallia sp. API 0066]MCD0448318.1 MobC family plasmid mobilization relaxosome protein [Actinocorallia sp. API 0066]